MTISNRRGFFRAAAAGALVSGAFPADPPAPNILGPLPGYSPQIGTLVSEMTWMRGAVLRAVKGLNQEQLDFLLDGKANRIGALILHLAATEKLYQLNTFDNLRGKKMSRAPGFKDWDVAMDLGERDDNWLMDVDKTWPWGPTNNLCKWFHVCEHELHHTGQIGLLRSRVPGAKPENG